MRLCDLCVSDFKIPVILKATTLTTSKLANYTLKFKSYPKPNPNSTNLNKLLPFCGEHYNKLFECWGEPCPKLLLPLFCRGTGAVCLALPIVVGLKVQYVRKLKQPAIKSS